MANAQIAVIGGSGLYQIEGLSDVEEVKINTPFGEPSDSIIIGTLSGVRVAFLPRHGRGHRISPSELPARANIFALKSLGVERIISVSAVGSLREEIAPLHLVIPDQLIDRTRGRVSTFFGGGIVVHVGFADPFCPVLSRILYEAAQGTGATTHFGGTYVVIEGPQFSTKAESRLYRSWGADIIGMTALPEAKLAREAEICYATLALVTDYDVWHATEQTVSVELVVTNLLKNVQVAKEIIKKAVTMIPAGRDCPCAVALKDAIITGSEYIPEKVKQDLSLLVGKYLS
ncbi:MAG: S-methyl-5'-thioadenosine phosphorylase [Chloroflexota bacterium]